MMILINELSHFSKLKLEDNPINPITNVAQLFHKKIFESNKKGRSIYDENNATVRQKNAMKKKRKEKYD